MAATANRIVPGGTSTTPSRRSTSTPPAARQPRGVPGLDAGAGRPHLADLAGVHFDIPEPIRPIECRVAPTNDGGVYYTGPSEDFSRPGRMWWSLPDGVEALTTWREVTTVYHEGVPGHHLQFAQAVLQPDLLNRWQRLLCWVSGHGEGWALYRERLMDELGYFDDPGDRLGFLDMQAFRAARVSSTSASTSGWRSRGTTRTAGVRARCGRRNGLRVHADALADGGRVARFEVNRYLGWPGQAPSYKVGERIWLQARADAQARHGDAFDLKAFHRAALDLGSIGLDPLRAALAKL